MRFLAWQVSGIALVPALVWVVSLGACSSSPPVTPPEAGPDVAAGDSGKPSPRPLAPPSDPEPFDVPAWMTTITLSPAVKDPVRLELEDGSFTMPDPGARADGTWSVRVPNASFGIAKPSNGTLLYAAAQIDVPQGRRVFARADTVLSVWTDVALVQPGDVYGAHKIRVPVATEGLHLVVVRGNGGRGEVQVELLSTPDELVFNSNDLTTHEPVEGSSTPEWLGVPVLNTSSVTALDVKAKVEASDLFEATTTSYPSLPAGSVTQLAFELRPKGPMPPAGTKVTVGVRLESDSLDFSYRHDIDLGMTVASGTVHKETFRSNTDGSAQYYGLVPPTGFDPQKKYALALSLHGASVEASGQAKSYSQKDWAYVVAATNRRPFGFDWESWGRRDALEVLDHAMSALPIDPTRVYLTGHSMGGHGTWNVGALFPGRFATLGPSAGWASYYTYAGLTKPTGAFARSQAPSDTYAYLSNLAKRGVYMIHGTADTNVPFSEGQALFTAVSMVTNDVQYHWEQGADHWWDGPASSGVDCVDWPALFDFMKAHALDPFELDFTYKTPAPWVNARHSYVTVRSQNTAFGDSVLTSSRNGDTVTLTTQNVRSMELDGSALDGLGVKTVNVDGTPTAVVKAAIAIGPQDGKRPYVHGPLNEVFYRPFCFAYADGAPPAYARWASYVTSSWQVNGNGHGCAVPLSKVTDELRKARNIVYLGVPSAQIPATAGLPVQWSATKIDVGAAARTAGVLAVVFPEGDRLSGAVMAVGGSERLLTRFMPLRPVASPPDLYVFDDTGVVDAAFFDPTWKTIVTK